MTATWRRRAAARPSSRCSGRRHSTRDSRSRLQNWPFAGEEVSYVPALLEHLCKSAPGVRLQVRSIDRFRILDGLDADRLDLGIGVFTKGQTQHKPLHRHFSVFRRTVRRTARAGYHDNAFQTRLLLCRDARARHQPGTSRAAAVAAVAALARLLRRGPGASMAAPDSDACCCRKRRCPLAGDALESR
jgi:hypothetical protein